VGTARSRHAKKPLAIRMPIGHLPIKRLGLWGLFLLVVLGLSWHLPRLLQTIYRARTIALLPELDTATRTVTVVFALLESAASALVPAQMARLHLEDVIETPGFWLPTTALTKGERDLCACFVLARVDGHEQPVFRAERRPVEMRCVESLSNHGRGPRS
jgi:hypothetical protein